MIMRIILPAIIMMLYTNVFSQDTNKTHWKYFKILANSNDDTVFYLLLEDCKLDTMQYYTITVDLRNDTLNKQVIIFGDAAEPDALKIEWSQLRKEVQNGLIKWRGHNKDNLEIRIIERHYFK